MLDYRSFHCWSVEEVLAGYKNVTEGLQEKYGNLWKYERGAIGEV